MTQKNQNPWTFDVRVRDRNLRDGLIEDKDVEKYLAGLPDLAEQTSSFSTPQPALELPEDFDDEEDDEDEDEDDEPALAEAAPKDVAKEEAPRELNGLSDLSE